MREFDLKHCFYSGKYIDVIAEVGRAPLQIKDSNDESRAIAQIGSLVFLGESDEALRLYRRALESPLSLYFKICARFYLAIAEVRRSRYSAAATLLAQNLQELRHNKELARKIEGFYITQGVAFFRFYKCQFERSAKYAEQAYLTSFEYDFSYGQALALDVLGQSLCFLGAIRRGLFEIERAHQACVKIGNGGLANAIALTRLCYRAQYGIFGKSSVHELRSALKNVDAQNNYSRCAIFLELARQLTLRGQVGAAQDVLNEAGETVYKNQNKRQLARYNHRQAYLLHLRGQSHAALALLRSAVHNLDPKMDHYYLAEYLGLERMITGQRVFESNARTSFRGYLDERIVSRQQNPTNSSLAGEDPLGDLLDEVRREGVGAFSKVVQLGLLGLIPRVLNLPVGEKAIYLGPSRGSLVLNSHGDVIFVADGVSAPMKKLLRLLDRKNFVSKETLIKEVWGYQYDPFVHDKLLHTTISKLRKRFGELSSWIEWSSAGYRLDPKIIVYESTQEVGKQDIERELVSSPAESLNHRQMLALRSIRDGKFYGVGEYARQFKVTKITACRDLSYLYKRNQVTRVGRGRATKYGLGSIL